MSLKGWKNVLFEHESERANVFHLVQLSSRIQIHLVIAVLSSVL